MSTNVALINSLNATVALYRNQSANQLTVFYMIGDLAFNELITVS